MGRGCCLYKKDDELVKNHEEIKKNVCFERGCEAGDVAVKEKS